ncbi:apolipoprotein N-acyltransferase [uncultured Roseovarius sp.]|uniref:apolipoprotein N-acyltransferase n=1 Tax=uncultured Roseovarius sp. TaxID=293344 RepID=UPI00263015CB|nr:apolipoprotein N-acyltransferase [uncultured Roseovarius sp.]
MTETVQPGFASRVNGVRGLYQLVIWLGLGALAALGQAPWGLWPLTIAALALIVALFRQTGSIRRAALLGWIAGTGYFMLALSWIVEPFLVDVARHGWIAPFALVGLSAGMALYWGAAFAAARALRGGSVALIVAFTVGEALRGILFTGFPWAQIGHVWIDTPMLQWAAFAGALGLTSLLVAAATALWHLVAGHRAGGGITLAIVAALYLTGATIAPNSNTPADAPTVRLIQPNAAQHEKWDREMMPVFFERQLDFSAAGDTRPDLIVWPETAIPVLLNSAESVLASISDAAGDVPVVLGLQRIDGPRLYNSAILLDAAGQVASVYDKHHLVPFGEYVPFGDTMKKFGIAGMASRDGNGYSSGPGAQVIDTGIAGKGLPLICYEGVFARDVRAAPERPDFLMMITNDAWFGEVSGPYQHLAQARLRSVEQGLPMVRAANTGISAMIDPAGRITAHLPLGQAGWIDAALPPALPPTLYARIGDLPVLALLLLILGGALLVRSRRPT